MTWLVNTSHGRVRAVALFHGGLGIVMTSPGTGARPVVMGAIITVCGLASPVVLGTANLSRAPRVQDPAC